MRFQSEKRSAGDGEQPNELTVLYRDHLDAMMVTAKKYVGQYQMEEDVVHNAILKLIPNLERIDLTNKASARSYICAIVHSCAIDWLRREKKLETVQIEECEELTSSDDSLPLELVMSRDGYERLIQCIGRLGDTYRTTCSLKFVCGLKEKEIARLLGITEKNVSVRIARGRRMLIQMIREEELHD